MYQCQCETDYETGYLSELKLGVCNAEDAQNENECKDNLNKQACNKVAVNSCETVGTYAAGLVCHAAESENSYKAGRSDDRTYTLSNHIRNEIFQFHSARK